MNGGGSTSGRAARRRFGILCVLGYMVLSWAVRIDMRGGPQMASLVYPLDTFSMYARIPAETISHLMVRDAGGAVHRVTDFSAFDCDAPVSGAAALCDARYSIRYLHGDLTRHIENHRGQGTAPVELIMRSWQVRQGALPNQIGDCVVARCAVAR